MDKTHSGDELSKTAATNEQNPNSPNTTAVQQSETNDRGVAAAVTSRTPFTDLSQVDADLALARTLQEQVLFSNQVSLLCLYHYMYARLIF